MNDENEKVAITKKAFTEWLEKLQQESWQLELLISGFALFAIWESRTMIDGYENYLAVNKAGSGYLNLILNSFSWLLTISWRIFFFNLLIHVLARGLWIGAIGLRYVSSDIDYDFFDYADNFTDFLKRQVGDFDDYIERLERFSSVIFAYTFLLFFVFLSLILFFAETFALFTLVDDPNIGGVIGIFIFFMGLIALIDFLTMGGIKKIKEKNISKIYFVFYRVFSFFTLSFLYRPLLYNFWDEKYTRRLFLFSIPYILFLTILPQVGSTPYPFFPEHTHYANETGKVRYEYHFYDDERALNQTLKKGIFRQKHAISRISLPSIELTGNYGRFFLRTYPSDAEWLKNEGQNVPFKKDIVTIMDWWNDMEDEGLKALDSLKTAETVPLRTKKLALIRGIKAKKITAIESGVMEKNGILKIDSLYWENKIDSVERIWWEKKEAYKLNKYKKLNNSILELATIKIDDVDFTDSCDCKFYVHPNLGEKGLRCYFPMENLAEGPHTLHLKRKEFYGNENKLERYYDFYIPFYKIIKDF